MTLVATEHKPSWTFLFFTVNQSGYVQSTMSAVWISRCCSSSPCFTITSSVGKINLCSLLTAWIFFVTLCITNSLTWRTTYQTTVCLGHKLQHSNIESHHWCLFKAASVCTASNQISICTSESWQTSTSSIQEGKIGWSRGSHNHTTRAEPSQWKCSVQNGTTLYLTWCGAPQHRRTVLTVSGRPSTCGIANCCCLSR